MNPEDWESSNVHQSNKCSLSAAEWIFKIAFHYCRKNIFIKFITSLFLEEEELYVQLVLFCFWNVEFGRLIFYRREIWEVPLESPSSAKILIELLGLSFACEEILRFKIPQILTNFVCFYLNLLKMNWNRAKNKNFVNVSLTETESI